MTPGRIFKTSNSFPCIAHMPWNDITCDTLTNYLQSLGSILTFRLPFTMWTNCNHNIFLDQGRNTPTWQRLQIYNKKQLGAVVKCHYDSPREPALTTKSWDFTAGKDRFFDLYQSGWLFISFTLPYLCTLPFRFKKMSIYAAWFLFLASGYSMLSIIGER